MINKKVHLLILDDEIFFSKEPFDILLLLYTKDKKFEKNTGRTVSDRDFAEWSVKFLQKYELNYSLKALQYIINDVRHKEEQIFAYVKELPILILNELYLRYVPEILYSEVDAENFNGLQDLIYLNIPDKEKADLVIKNIKDKINSYDYGNIRIRT